MEYFTYNMILRTLIWLTVLGVLDCYPNRRRIKLPDLDVSKPEEVNSLEREEPFGRSIDPQNNRDNNINETVKEVEEIIKLNPTLPRLTRGEILDLLENITAQDKQKKNVLGKNRHPKAVMVVMPYTPSSDKSLEEFYTKPPVTQIIGNEPFKHKEENDTHRRPLLVLNDTDNDLAKKPLHVEEKKKYSASINEKFIKPTPPRTSVRRKRPEAVTQVPLTTYPTTTTTSQPPTRRPARRKSTTTRHPNHRYSQEFAPSVGIRIIESPKLGVSQSEKDASLPDLELQENIRQEVVAKQESPISASYVSSKPNHYKITTTKPPKTKPLIEEINLPESLKLVAEDLNLENALKSKKEQLINNMEEQNRIRNILASIGVIPDKITTTTTTTTTMMPNAESVADSLSPDMRELLMSFGLLPNPDKKPEQNNPTKYYPEKAEVKPESYVGFKPLPDDGPGREDMDALLASFGLGRSVRKEKSVRINYEGEEKTYNFDMIPEHLKGVVEDLGLSEMNREEKKIRTTHVEKVVEKQHIFNPDTQYATEEELKKLEKLLNMIKQLEKMNHTVTEEDLKKLDLEGLKELVTSFNGNSNETLETLDQKEDDSPDPNNFDNGLDKNEVKREEESTTVVSVSSTPKVKRQEESLTLPFLSSTPITVESETPSIKDLEASFGGQTETEAATEPPVPEVTTRRTGFYYLVDWNTFLDIDDTKGKRVNLRFQPTIGDPKRFLSVKVP